MIRGNRHIVKLVAVVLIASLGMTLVGCGTEKYDNPYEGLNLAEYVTVGDYINLEVTMEKVKVTDNEVQEEITKRLQAASKQVEVKEGTAKLTDDVRIAYVGKLDGVAFEGGSTGEEGTVITLGNSGYIDGFDAGVIGMKVGEKKDLNLTFPKDYSNAELAGEEVIFEVELLAIVNTEVPKYDENFVKENSNVKTIDAYEELVKKELKEQKELAAKNSAKDELWMLIMEGSKVEKYPEDILEKVKKENEEMDIYYANQYGMSIEDFVAASGMTMEEYEQEQVAYSEAMVAQELVMYSIAEIENITVSSSEYDKALKELLAGQGAPDEATLKELTGMNYKEYEEAVGKDKLVMVFLMDKILEFVLENAKVKVE